MIDTLTLVPLYYYSEFVSCRAAENNIGEQRIYAFLVVIHHVEEHWN